jgi:hypothetical protein
LVISEWGLGGGTQDGNGIAGSLADVAGHPFFGLWYPYATSKDPWRNQQYNDYRYTQPALQYNLCGTTVHWQLLFSVTSTVNGSIAA